MYSTQSSFLNLLQKQRCHSCYFTIVPYTIEFYEDIIILSDHSTGQRVDLHYDKIHPILEDYKQMDTNQFILAYGKDPFSLNNFKDDILLEFKTRIEYEPR